MTAQITASMVKELREATSAGMMDCKKALSETGGDFDAAVTLLREKGIARATKLSGREATEGRINVLVEGNVGVVVKMGCNTDFVARNDDFGTFVDSIARHIAKHDPADVDALLAQPWADGGTVEDARSATSAGTGENIVIAGFNRFDVADGILGTYLHGTGIGAMVDVEGPDTDEVRTFATDVAMHIAAARPQYLVRDEVPADAIEAERAIYIKQVEDKPEQIRGKIADGKLSKWYSDIVLTEQGWVFGKDRVGKDVTISEYADMVAKQAGGDVKIRRFALQTLK